MAEQTEPRDASELTDEELDDVSGGANPTTKLSQTDLAKQIAAWSRKQQTIGEDAQLANMDLQNTLQKQQQTMQMMSNISKMLHDTSMATIRKIGG